MHHAAAPATGDRARLVLALTVLAGWLLVRAWTWLQADAPAPTGSTPVGAAGWLRTHVGVVRGGGGLLMLAAMTTMVT